MSIHARVACTRRSARPSPRRGGCRRATPIFRTSQFAASSAATFGADSFRDRIGCSLSADYSQIELRLLAHLSGDPGVRSGVSSRADDIHRQTAAAHLRGSRPIGHEGHARAREDDQLRHDLWTGRARAVAPAQDRARRGEGVHRDATSSDFIACASISIRWSSSRARTDMCRPSSIGAATSRSCETGTSTFARSASAPRRTPRFRDRPPT